jgi:molecular chaperone HtpG
MTKGQIGKKSGKIKTDFKGLIELLAKNLYPQEDMFIRELIQNAHDSIVKRETIETEPPAGKINITVNRESRTITFEDNGVGMTAQEIEEYLATIGRSGTGEFRKHLQEKDRNKAQMLIGQFGIGILSAFVVAERLVVETCSVVDPPNGLRWSIEGGDPKWVIEPIKKDTPGTIVTVYLKHEHLKITNLEKLKSSVLKYADFLPFPIYINREGPVNTINAPWHRSYSTDEERKGEYMAWVDRRFPDIPLEIIPVDLDSPYTIKGVLYISDRHIPDINMAGMVDIYQSRMFICEGDRNLLPLWAKFVRGVIDSPHLKPTAARDAVQQDNKVYKEIRKILGQLIIDAIKRIAREDPQRFYRLMKWHHYHIKGMALQFDDFFDAIADMVIFEINQKEADGRSFKMVTLRDYCNMQNITDERGRKIIYYISEYGAASQFYRLCQARGIFAINAGLVFEEEFLRKYADKHSDEVVLERVDIAGGTVIFEPLTDAERQKYLEIEYSLRVKLRQALPDQETIIQTERFLPSEIPAVLTQTKEREVGEKLKDLADNPMLSTEMREVIIEALGIQQHRLQPVVLHINANNPLINQLCREDFDNPLIQDVWMMVYNNAFLYSRQFLSIQNIEALYEQTIRALDSMLDLLKEVRQLNDRLSQFTEKAQEKRSIYRTEHISLFVMMPFGKEYDLLEEALRKVLEGKDYYFQVILARDRTLHPKLFENVKRHMSLVHGFIADVSDLNPNVMLELGITMVDPEERPVIIFHRKGSQDTPADLKDRIYVEYNLPSENSPNRTKELPEQLRRKFKQIDSIDKLLERRNKRYLSVTLLKQTFGQRITSDEATNLSKRFQTIEELENASDKEIKEAGIDECIIPMIKAVFQKS